MYKESGEFDRLQVVSKIHCYLQAHCFTGLSQCMCYHRGNRPFFLKNSIEFIKRMRVNKQNQSVLQYLNLIFIDMGNQTNKSARISTRNRNSFSLDFSHRLPQKILPTRTDSSDLKLQPIQHQTKISRNRFAEMSSTAFGQNERESAVEDKNNSQVNQSRLNKLMITNDQLRKQLMKISTELTSKLQKKKFRKKEIKLPQDKARQREALGKQLENAYKQVSMYKKNLQQLKSVDISAKADSKIAEIQNKIALVDQQISKTVEDIQSFKNVMDNQKNGIQKQRNGVALQEIEESKEEIEGLKNRIKNIGKESRRREKKYMEQHQYMFALEDKIKQLQNQQMEKKMQEIKQRQQQKHQERMKQIAVLQQQAEQLKIKHDLYHKKINSLILEQKSSKQLRKNLKIEIEDKNKQIQSLKYKRDAMVKQIKDHLDLFANAPESQQQQFSQFQSDDQEVDQIAEEQDQRGTFDVNHLRDHNIKQKIDREKNKPRANEFKYQETEVEPKLWQKMVTRIVQRGKHMDEEVKFVSGIKQPKMDMKIVEMYIWMNKKKQILSIQPIYLVDNLVKEGNKSSNNSEDEYKVVYKLEEHDFLKSILGIFGKQGFLQYLVLQSNFGKISRIGRGQTIGDNFAIGVAKEETPVQIAGASSFDGAYNRINRLQVQVLLDYTINKG